MNSFINSGFILLCRSIWRSFSMYMRKMKEMELSAVCSCAVGCIVLNSLNRSEKAVAIIPLSHRTKVQSPSPVDWTREASIKGSLVFVYVCVCFVFSNVQL
ncbi:hypothetical protein KP509_33G067200 [Ceratopteris richardii]|uniref:Uncharacterized protein n=1 Tax=Ceratopteris richardii TaxID=49495 RepID=A0A8T2QRS1_CERRI|nr:hypothetical protein KP509_33G067200 [Ceratopteris richardii]